MKRKSHLKIRVCLALVLGVASGAMPDAAGADGKSPGSVTLPSTADGTSAAAATTLTLNRAIDLALANNPDLRASRARVEAAAGRADQARRWPNPELELAGEDVPLEAGTFRDSKNTIGLSQTVPFFGKKKLDGRIGAAEVSRVEAEMNLRRLELVRDVRTAFYRVLAAERLVIAANELCQLSQSSTRTARARVDAGAAAEQEALRAEIQLEQSRASLGEFQRDLHTARVDLANALGRPDLAGAPLAGALDESPAPPGPDVSPGQWLAHHPSLLAARASRYRANLELRRARLDPYPDPTLGVDGGREGRDDNAIIQFRVSLPLPILDRSRGRKREARANVGAADAELAGTEQRLLRDWAASRQRFHTARDQVEAYRERILPKANDALRLVRAGFEEGKFEFIDLLDTQRTAAEAQLEYQQKLFELNAAGAELEALLGASTVPGQTSASIPFAP